MKIAVLGTSNSIRKEGYVPVYQVLESPNIVDNYSQGSNIIQYGQWALMNYNILENYDFLITDFCVNHGAFLDKKIITPNWLYNELFSFMLKIKQSKCKHLDLILYNSEWTYSHIARRLHIAVCKELEIPYIDVMSLIHHIEIDKNISLFFDSSHLNSFYAIQLAYLIKQKRIEIFNIETNDDYYNIKNPSKDYYFLSLADLKQESVKSFGTSFSVCQCYELNNNTTIKINKSDVFFEGFQIFTSYRSQYLTIEIDNIVYNKCISFIVPFLRYFYSIVEPLYIKKDLFLGVGYDKQGINLPRMSDDIECCSNNDLVCYISDLLFSRSTKSYIINQEKLDNFFECNYNDLNAFQQSYKTARNIFYNKQVSCDNPEILYVSYCCSPNKVELLYEGIKRFEQTYFYYKLVEYYFNNCQYEKLHIYFEKLQHLIENSMQLSYIYIYISLQQKKYIEALEKLHKLPEFFNRNFLLQLLYLRVCYYNGINVNYNDVISKLGFFSENITINVIELLDLINEKEFMHVYLNSYLKQFVPIKKSRFFCKKYINIKLKNSNSCLLLIKQLIILKQYKLTMIYLKRKIFFMIKKFFLHKKGV